MLQRLLGLKDVTFDVVIQVRFIHGVECGVSVSFGLASSSVLPIPPNAGQVL
jgi:hypothetical protein